MECCRTRGCNDSIEEPFRGLARICRVSLAFPRLNRIIEIRRNRQPTNRRSCSGPRCEEGQAIEPSDLLSCHDASTIRIATVNRHSDNQFIDRSRKDLLDSSGITSHRWSPDMPTRLAARGVDEIQDSTCMTEWSFCAFRGVEVDIERKTLSLAKLMEVFVHVRRQCLRLVSRPRSKSSADDEMYEHFRIGPDCHQAESCRRRDTQPIALSTSVV
jgi:hypothetical protein